MTKTQFDWQRRRSEFNHQWLKNRFISALDTVDNAVRGRIHANGCLREFVEIDLPEWPRRRPDVKKLIADLERELSPRRCLDSPPLSECDPATRELIGELIHELWLARYPISEWVSKSENAIAQVDECYRELEGISPLNSSGQVDPKFADRFASFRSACRALSKAIEKLPNGILVT